jgi:hypothetical protein
VTLGLELRAYTLSHYTSPFLWWVFSRQGLENYLPGLALNHDFLISASWVARIIGVSLWHLASLVIFEIGSCILPTLVWTLILIYIFCHSWNDRYVPPCPLKWGLKNFCPIWPLIMLFHLSVSQVAITFQSKNNCFNKWKSAISTQCLSALLLEMFYFFFS